VSIEDGSRQLIGRAEADLCFPDDEHMNAQHAALTWRDAGLWLEDLKSENGVFVRIRSSVPMLTGDRFLAGEQLFEFETSFSRTADSDPQATRFNGTPSPGWNFRVIQIMDSGVPGTAWPVFSNSFCVGRNAGDARFPRDRYMSRDHCRVQRTDVGFELDDLGSRNGTYHRIKSPHRLQNGDYVLIGSRLLRVTCSS
jgi:pSer/pThr/pTyr-binding forkhead associated (FHA) protein